MVITSRNGNIGDSAQLRLAHRTESLASGGPLIAGQLLAERTGYPLGGLSVSATVTASPRRATLVGSAVSDAGGRFFILANANTEDILRLIGQRGVSLTLSIADAADSLWLQTPDVSDRVGSDNLGLTLKVPEIHATGDDWAEFAKRLTERMFTRIHEAIGQLVLAPPEASVVGDWPLALRHAMSLALEQAFFDPTGALSRQKVPPTFFEFNTKQQWQAYRRDLEALNEPEIVTALDYAEALYKSYPGLYRVDWEMDVDAMSANDLTTAASKFADLYKESDSKATVFVPFVKSPLVPYRDYLRALFAGSSNSDVESQTKLADLTRRFHQNFKTSSGNIQPANAILIGILKDILTAPAGDHYGFGKSPASIPTQGSLTLREYLDVLIELTGLSATELGKRYRLDFGRPDFAQSTLVEENIATLQGFFRDGFQSAEDPFPIYPKSLHGKAPFFLFLDEWQRRTGPFYAENLYRFTDTFRAGVYAEHMQDALGSAVGEDEEAWFLKTITAQELIAEGHDGLRKGQHGVAIDKYNQALALALEAMRESVKVHADSTNQTESEAWHDVPDLIEPGAQSIRGKTLESEPDLASFLWWARWHGRFFNKPNQSGDFAQWMDQDLAERWLSLIRVCGFVLPACIAEAALASGDYATAVYGFSLGTRRLVGRGPGDLVAPYREFTSETSGSYTSGILYREGSLPYTMERPTNPQIIELGEPRFPPGSAEDFAYSYHDQVLHEMEKRWLQLRQADALLQWADSLYRTDEDGSVQRARELYKAALFVLRASPAISPEWELDTFTFFINGTENPALTVFKGQARKGILQIDAGLNYYGADDSLVPHLRYRTLKEAADRFAVAAKSAEVDLLAYIGKIEDAMVEQIVHSNMLAKARLQAAIASEQSEIAKFEVGLAQRQVETIKAEIKKKKEELEDESGLFEQFKDVIVGMKDTITGLPEGLTGFIKSGATASAGSSGASLTGTAALAAGAGVMAGYGVFLYAGISSLSSVQDNLTSLEGQIDALENSALPLAQSQVIARQRQVTIANLQHQIAEADAELARDLIRFAEIRFLNVDFWAELANLTRRTLRRYLTLGGRFAWLAERALAFEQDRALDIVRLDYVPVKFQGITGATQLLSDMAELEASRIDGLRQGLPMRQSWSLAFDFPLQFAQLKATGRCDFNTSDGLLKLAHLGTYAHRIETVRVRPQNLLGVNPYRGLLRNTGMSTVTRVDGSTHLSLRFEDALPLTEPGADGWVSTPAASETLGLFEGNGVHTGWMLELPAAANPYGLQDLADVLFTIEARAHYSSELYDEQQETQPTSVQKFLALSAAKYSPQAFVALLDPNVTNVDLNFDIESVSLPAIESDRVVTNLFVALAAPGDGVAPVQVKVTTPPNVVAATLEGGVALSNAGALASGQPPQALNALVGQQATQTFTVSLDKSQLGNIDVLKLKDVVLGLEYSADVQPSP